MMVRNRLLIAAAGCALLVAALPSSATAAGQVTAKVSECVSAPMYADRRLTFTGTMKQVAGASRMQMRVRMFRLTDERRRAGRREYKRMSGTSAWAESMDPNATTFVRNVEFNGAIESATTYKGLIEYRWKRDDGKAVAKASRWSNACRQKNSLPDLVVQSIVAYPGAPSWNTDPSKTQTYVVSVYNKGGSSASSLGVVTLAVASGGGVQEPTTDQTVKLDFIPSKTSKEFSFAGPACAPPLVATWVGGPYYREKNTKNNSLARNC